MMLSRLIGKVEAINEALDLSFAVEKSARTGNRVYVYKRLRDGTMGQLYTAPNCAIAAVWIEAYTMGWCSALGK
jgi:hypothetical protein